jgi:ATP/maltotriose-dependent transcriptional regulator MalT
MFAGNALEHTGEPASAAKAFQAAARVFPEAQSPRLALSRLALESGDQAAARAILEQMHSIRTEADEDPWWIYHHGTGRDTDSILQTFADQMRALPAGGGAERARR